MNKLFLLLSPSFYSLLGINKAKHTSDTSARNKTYGMLLLYLFVFASCGFSVYQMVDGISEALAALNGLNLMIPLVVTALSAGIILLTFARAGSTLLRFKDYDRIVSMPFRSEDIAASRFLLLYGYTLMVALFFIVPALISLALRGAMTPTGWFVMAVTLLVGPALPTVIAALLGILVTWIASHFRKSNAAQTVFLFVLMLVIFFISFLTGSASDEMGSASAAAGQISSQVYLPARWVMNAFEGRLLDLLWFVLLNAASVVLFVRFFGKTFLPLHTRIESIRPRVRGQQSATDGSLSELRGGMLRALYSKERRRYFASPLWVTNTAFAPVMLLIAAIASFFIPFETLFAMLPDDELNMVFSMIAYIVGFMVSTCAVSGSSVSMEGRSFWILRTCPIPGGKVCLAKFLWSLTVCLPAVLLADILLAIALPMSPFCILLLFVLTVEYGVLASALGLLFNLLFPKLDWTQEAQVVKQSFAAFLPVLAGMVLAFVPMFTVIFFPDEAYVISAVTVAVLLIMNVVTLLILWKRGERMLTRIRVN